MGRGRLAADKKKASRLGAHLVFIDETGLMRLPIVQRSWAPIGETPVLHHPLRHHQKISAIGGLSISPRRRRVNLYLHMYGAGTITECEVIVFLRDLLRHLRGPLIVIWDRINQHRSVAVKAFIAARWRLQVECLPAYAPELNPAEWVWCEWKAHRLANHGAEDLEALEHLAISEVIDMRRSQELLRGCVRGTGLPIRLH